MSFFNSSPLSAKALERRYQCPHCLVAPGQSHTMSCTGAACDVCDRSLLSKVPGHEHTPTRWTGPVLGSSMVPFVVIEGDMRTDSRICPNCGYPFIAGQVAFASDSSPIVTMHSACIELLYAAIPRDAELDDAYEQARAELLHGQ